MNGNKFLLDTNAVLYILNGDQTLADFLFEKELYISIISEMELLSYKHITEQEEQAIKNFLSAFTIININENIKLISIEVKKVSNLKLPDSIIAATAMFIKLPLVTADRQFKTIKNLDLLYYEK